MKVPEKTEVNDRALKHQFGPDLLKRLSVSLGSLYPPFDQVAFVALAPRLLPLEMKARVHLIRDELKIRLPSNYAKALSILVKSAQSGTLEGFDLWPYVEFVQAYGLENPELSLQALKTLTTVFTSEWAVRPFIKKCPAQTLKYLLQSATDKNFKIRRWASEGSRPRLPWGERLHAFIQNPEPTLPILEKLKFDPELFVRTSVANHLNDIAKDHPELVIKILRRWKSDAALTHSAKIDWIIKRALRNLIKSGHAEALKLIGIAGKAKIAVVRFQLSENQINLGDRLGFDLAIRSESKETQKLAIDYIVHFVKANGATAPKVFKLKVVDLRGGETLKILKTHHFKKITTRTYYAGAHFIELQINGISSGKRGWKLKI